MNYLPDTQRLSGLNNPVIPKPVAKALLKAVTSHPHGI